MYFAIYALDRLNALELRLATRESHRAYLHAKHGEIRLMLAGPLLAADGKTMIGSLIVIEARSLDDATAFAAGDPYRTANLSASVDIRPWNWTTGNPEWPPEPPV